MRNLTAPNIELEKAEQRTVPGMAFWAGTGPAKATCGKCANYGYYYEDSRNDRKHRAHGCALYWKQMKKHGERSIPESTAACKYFEPLIQESENA
jgi:hypothetical protein